MAGQAVTHIHLTLLKSLHNHEAGIRTDGQAEFLHDFRVAVRRTRAILTQIKYIYPDEIVRPIRMEFAWLGRATGPRRDLVVFLLNLADFKTQLPASMRETLDPFCLYLQSHQQVEHRRLLQTLDSPRYHRLTSKWHAFLTSPDLLHAFDTNSPGSTRDTCGGRYWKEFQNVLVRSALQSIEKHAINIHRPIEDVASERIWRTCRRVYKLGSPLTDSTLAEALHLLRIECKKLRCLLEFFQSICKPSVVDQLTRSLKRLQDNVGKINDCEVQQVKLKMYSTDMKAQDLAPTETFLAIDYLVKLLRQRQTKERIQFRKCFTGFSKEKNRDRFRRLFKK